MNGSDLFKGLVIGMVAGIATGIMIAPKSGKETREQIAGTISKMKNDLSEKLNKTKDVTKATYGDIVEEVVSTYEQNKEITKDQAKKIRIILSDAAKEIQH